MKFKAQKWLSLSAAVLLVAGVGSALVPTGPFASSVVSATAVKGIQPSVSLGATLNSAGMQRTLELLGAQGVAAGSTYYVDGVDVNHYLSDGSSQATPVYSSAYIEPRQAGYGVQVQVVTPNTILNVSPQTYINAAVTAGAQDVLIRIASVEPVTGEGALAGVYKMYEAAGYQLNAGNVQTAQKEIQVVGQVKQSQELTEAQINQLQTQIKTAINERIQSKGDTSDAAIEALTNQVIDSYLKEVGLKLSDANRRLLVDYAKAYAKSEAAKNQTTDQQLVASTQNVWTTEQAIDYFEGVFFNNVYNNDRFDRSLYDRASWKEVKNEGHTITLQLGTEDSDLGVYIYELIHKDDQVVINQYAQADYPNFASVQYMVDRASSTILHEKHPHLMGESGRFASFKPEDAAAYLRQAVTPGRDDIVADVVDPMTDGSYRIQLASTSSDSTGAGLYAVTPEGLITELNIYRDTVGQNYYQPGVMSLAEAGQISESASEATDESSETESISTENAEVQSAVQADTTEEASFGGLATDVPVWTQAKQDAFDQFFSEWQVEMGQSYLVATPVSQLNMYGVNFPVRVMELLAVNDTAVEARWANFDEPLVADTYNVVAAYRQTDPEAMEYAPHFYLMAIYNGKPVVLHSQQNQGMPDERIHFTPTENVDLQSNFERIYQGE